MAEIFAVFTGAILSIAFRNRTIAMLLIGLGLLLMLGVFWHHITSVLKINL